jgi:hypothetical protein
MRPLLPLLFLAACACVTTAQAGPGPTSTSILLHLHPHAWHPPVAPLAAGLRTDVDAPVSALELPDAAAAHAARQRALANVRVQMRPDGSGFAVVGGLLRAYSVARIGDDGRLVEDCAHSEEEALKMIAAPPPATTAKGGK